MKEQIKTDFDKIIKNLKLSKKDIKLRQKNLNKFIQNGFPNKRIEDWKFSDLNQIISDNIKELKFSYPFFSNSKAKSAPPDLTIFPFINT